MSVAKSVCEVDPELNWLKIDDEDGGVWQYDRVQLLDYFGAQQHVSINREPGKDLTATLEKLATGQVALRQNGPGLPKKIVVRYRDAVPKSAGSMDLLETDKKFEYAQR
jgi:hypothetical protein